MAAASEEAEPAAEEPSADAEAIFARLRSITSQPVGEPEPRSAESGVADDEAAPEAADEFADEYADEPDELADEYEGGSEAATMPG